MTEPVYAQNVREYTMQPIAKRGKNESLPNTEVQRRLPDMIKILLNEGIEPLRKFLDTFVLQNTTAADLLNDIDSSLGGYSRGLDAFGRQRYLTMYESYPIGTEEREYLDTIKLFVNTSPAVFHQDGSLSAERKLGHYNYTDNEIDADIEKYTDYIIALKYEKEKRKTSFEISTLELAREYAAEKFVRRPVASQSLY